MSFNPLMRPGVFVFHIHPKGSLFRFNTLCYFFFYFQTVEANLLFWMSFVHPFIISKCTEIKVVCFVKSKEVALQQLLMSRRQIGKLLYRCPLMYLQKQFFGKYTLEFSFNSSNIVSSLSTANSLRLSSGYVSYFQLQNK